MTRLFKLHVTIIAIFHFITQSSHIFLGRHLQLCPSTLPCKQIMVIVYGMVWYGMVWYGLVWYGIVEFNVPLDTIKVISETGALSRDVHLSFSNGGPAT